MTTLTPTQRRRLARLRAAWHIVSVTNGRIGVRELAQRLSCATATAHEHLKTLCAEGHIAYISPGLYQIRIPLRPGRVVVVEEHTHDER